MADYHEAITAEQRDLIESSALFFIASADPTLGAGPQGQGAVNVSPKGNTPLRVLSDRQVAYLDFHGSGNETARHAEAGGPVTVMVTSFEAGDAAIVRLYGHARVEPLDESAHASLLLADTEEKKGMRQVIVVDVERTQTSCGYGVPVYEFRGQRERSQRGRRFK